MARKTRGAKKKGAKKETRRDGALPLAKKKLGDSISELAYWRLRCVVQPGTPPRYVRIASRYDELCEAIEASRGGRGGRWSHQLPFWADALVLQMEVDAEVAKMHPHPQGWRGWTTQRLAALERHKWRPQDAGVMQQHAATLAAFNKRIDKLFAPNPIGLPDPCPECKAKWAYRDSDGEPIRVMALQITEDGCTCGNCHANWPIDHLPLLGKILERARAVNADAS